jgi:LacI family transcriptional regulator
VSTGTASKALSGGGQLRPSTRQRVLAAAEELGFHPSPVARALLSGRTYTVGLLTSDSLGRFSIPLLLGAEDSLATGEIAILLCDARADPIREQYYIRTLLARQVDGFIVTGHRSDPRPSITASLPVPVVYAYTPSDNPDDLSVVPDDVQGGRLAGQHLIALGRRRIAYVGGPERYAASHLRLRGLRQALEPAEVDVVGDPLFGEWQETWGRQAGQVLLRSTPDIDAVFCASDQIARGVCDTLRDHSVGIPDDIAVVGFDNWDEMVLASRPPLTSVDMRLRLVGEVAANHLLQAIAGRPQSGLQPVDCGLVVRESSVRS